MQITKCDICKKTIKDWKEKVLIEYGFLERNTFCLKCGKPVIDFLGKNKLLKRDD